MGTSKAYGSPKWPGVNRTVGQVASQDNPSTQSISTAIGSFTQAYRDYISSGSITPSVLGSHSIKPGSPQSTSRDYSKGGGSGIASRVRSATSGARLGHFIGTAQRLGMTEALRQFDISDIRDAPLDEFLDSLIERLSGDGSLLDDDSLSRAMAMTIDELAQNIDSVDEFEELLRGDEINMELALQSYYANLLSVNFEQKEYSIVRVKVSLEDTSAFFNQAKEIIRAIVTEELATERDLSSLDWNSVEGLRIADEINQEVLRILLP